MSCRRAFDLDLVDFLARSAAPEFADFRAHYPLCLECAPEVRAWTELDLALRGGAPHPAPDRLFRLAERRADLPAGEREALERHLAGCPSCRDELTALRRFDFDALLAPGTPRRWRWRFPALASSPFGRLVLHPAFAYAVVLLLLVYPNLVPRLTAPQEMATRQKMRGPAAASPSKPAAALPEPRPPDRALAARDEQVQQRLRSLGYVSGGSRGVAEPEPPPADAGAAERRHDGLEKDALARAPLAEERTVVRALREPDGWSIVRLTPGRNEVVLTEREGIALRVPVPAELRAVDLELRVRDAHGRRELRERFAGAGGEVETRLPRRWLLPGEYQVELWAPSLRPRPETFALLVR